MSAKSQLTASVDIRKYVKGKRLGEGEFGYVHLYEIKKDEMPDQGVEKMAVKELLAEGKKRSDNVQKEVEIMCKLQHPNIVHYLGAVDNGENLFIMLEYMPGGSVAYQLEKLGAPLLEEKTKSYTRDVLEGLRYLHENKTLHRDIKGDNILVNGDGRAKLADFGLSKILGSKKSAHSCAGTYQFMSPEMTLTCQIASGHGFKTDIWSIGCAVVQMLSRSPPWKAYTDKTPEDLMKIISNCKHPEYNLPDGVSEGARDFINKCFIKEAKDRPTADVLLGHKFIGQ